MMPNGAQQQSSPTNSLSECPGNLLDFQRMFPDEAACYSIWKKCVGRAALFVKNALKLINPLASLLVQECLSVDLVITNHQ